MRFRGVDMSGLWVRAAVGALLGGLVAAFWFIGRVGPPVGADPGSERPRLLVIGDSIILGTQNNIAANLPDWDVTFDAAVSRSTSAGLDALAAHGTDYSVVVVSLGANDGGEPGVFTPRVAALLDALAGVPHVIWVTIHEARPYYATTNAVIRDQVARHSNAIVGDWNDAIRPGDTGEDGLHLTGQGSQAMAVWVAALVRFVSIPPPTTTTTSTTTTSTTTTTLAPTTTPPPTTDVPVAQPTLIRHFETSTAVAAARSDGHEASPWIAEAAPWAVLAAMLLLAGRGWWLLGRR